TPWESATIEDIDTEGTIIEFASRKMGGWFTQDGRQITDPDEVIVVHPQSEDSRAEEVGVQVSPTGEVLNFYGDGVMGVSSQALEEASWEDEGMTFNTREFVVWKNSVKRAKRKTAQWTQVDDGWYADSMVHPNYYAVVMDFEGQFVWTVFHVDESSEDNREVARGTTPDLAGAKQEARAAMEGIALGRKRKTA